MIYMKLYFNFLNHTYQKMALKIAKDTQDKILQKENLTSYRLGFYIKYRQTTILPIKDLLVQHDPILSKNNEMNSARHSNNGKGTYLNLVFKC